MPYKTRGEFQQSIWDSLGGSSQQAMGMYIQKQEEKKKTQQALKDAIKKAVIESVLSGKGKFKTPVDMNQMIEGGQMPNLGDFEATPDLSDMRAKLGMQNLIKKMDNERRLGVMAGQEEPSQEDITQISPELPQFGKLGFPAEGGMVIPAEGQNNEFMPGYEPKPIPIAPEEIAGKMREKFAGGIPKEDLQRKAMGIPFTGQSVSATTAVNIIADPLKSRELKQKNPELYKKVEEVARKALFKGQAINAQPEQDIEDEIMDTNW